MIYRYIFSAFKAAERSSLCSKLPFSLSLSLILHSLPLVIVSVPLLGIAMHPRYFSSRSCIIIAESLNFNVCLMAD